MPVGMITSATRETTEAGTQNFTLLPTPNTVPVIEDYGIDFHTGFMPNLPPLRRLPIYYEKWEIIMDSLSALILTCQIRPWVLKTSLLEVDYLTSKALRQRAHSILTFIAHAYIYGVPSQDKVEFILPKAIAIPWFKVAKLLDINPVASYSSVGLWNWYLLDRNHPPDLSNLATIHTWTGSFDESWFYLVPLSIEFQGVPIINAIIEAQHAVLADDAILMELKLTIIADTINKLTSLLKRMYEKCDPAVFWKRIRHYSGGTKNSESFPSGLFYEGVVDVDRHVVHNVSIPDQMTGTWRKYPGASAGQSPLIHTIDVALGIQHKSIKVHISEPSHRQSEGSEILMKSKAVNPMLEMRESLPGEFQQFIRHLEVAPSIREFCELRSGSLAAEFNRACLALKKFRDQHIQLATHYIISQRKGGKACIGTGGTDLVPFLKQVRAETENNIII